MLNFQSTIFCYNKEIRFFSKIGFLPYIKGATNEENRFFITILSHPGGERDG